MQNSFEGQKSYLEQLGSSCCFKIYLDGHSALQGFLGVMVAGQVLFYFLFKLGKLLRRAIQQAKTQVMTDTKEE